MYKYFVSYSFEGGYGRCEITRDSLIEGIEDIFEIEESIHESNKKNKIVVLNYQLFKEE